MSVFGFSYIFVKGFAYIIFLALIFGRRETYHFVGIVTKRNYEKLGAGDRGLGGDCRIESCLSRIPKTIGLHGAGTVKEIDIIFLSLGKGKGACAEYGCEA